MSDMKKRDNKSLSFIKKQRNLIVAFLIIFAILALGFFAVIRPLINEEEAPQAQTEPPVAEPGEVIVGDRILMYELIDRDEIKDVKIHNPDNDERYVDWGFYVKEEEYAGETYSAFYLTGYEYAPVNTSTDSGAGADAYLINCVGVPTVTSRVEKGCTDFSKYGLEYSDGAHDDAAKYYLITKTDGTTHKIYIGDKIPSGTGYYARCADTVTVDGQTKVRDSVYVLSAATLDSTVLATPAQMVLPILTYPLQLSSTTSALFDAFAVSDRDGSLNVEFLPVDHVKNDPFASFAQIASYKSVTPAGYYSSSTFEGLNELFSDFNGLEVVELARLDEKGNYSFSESVFEEYGLTNARYSIFYSCSGIDSAVYFSDIQSDGYYYAYSLTFNTICRVQPNTVYFLEWETSTYIQPELIMIDKNNAAHISVKAEEKDIDEGFSVDFEKAVDEDGLSSTKLTITADNTGKQLDPDNYTSFFTVLLNIYQKGVANLDKDQLEEITSGTPYAEFSVTTKQITVLKKDESGNDTAKLDYVVEPVTRIFRFYRYSNGRCVFTVESVDTTGASTLDSSGFYVRTSALDKLTSDAEKLANGILIDKRARE